MLRILGDPNDLVAHRNLVSLLPQMGAGRCLDLTERCLRANMSAVDLYQGHIPSGVLTSMQDAKIQEVRAIAGTIQAWDLDDTLAQRSAALAQLVDQVSGAADRQEWDAFTQTLPQDATLGELCQLLYSDNLEETGAMLIAIHERLGLPVPPAVDPDRVQIMTMHGAKGLSAKVVFIPGLEETVFPNRRRAAKVGLLNEGARLLYVSITRARAAVFLSGTHSRNQNGAFVQNAPCRYLSHSGLQMEYRQPPGGVHAGLARQIAANCAAL
jgi:superfamily I DNA/RNA helicase